MDYKLRKAKSHVTERKSRSITVQNLMLDPHMVTVTVPRKNRN